MKINTLTLLLFITILDYALSMGHNEYYEQGSIWQAGRRKTNPIKDSGFIPKMVFTEAQLMQKLTSYEYKITQEAMTEEPVKGRFYKFDEKGTYNCKICDEYLFHSKDKFNTRMGYASFNKATDNIFEIEDKEKQGKLIHCNTCGSHIGHVFDDPTPWGPVMLRSKTGRSYLVNSASLIFEKENEEMSEMDLANVNDQMNLFTDSSGDDRWGLESGLVYEYSDVNNQSIQSQQDDNLDDEVKTESKF